MNQWTAGELAFAEYLTAQGIGFDHEPPLSFTDKLIDFVIDHPTLGKIYLEVKDINCPPPAETVTAFDPYLPIRNHIEEGQKKFKGAAFADQLCALVLFAPPGSFVHMEPYVMLGAMYGNFGWTFPVNTETGLADASRIESTFIMGKGKMVRPTQFPYQNTRIAAIISLLRYNMFAKEAVRYLNTDNGRTEEERRIDLYEGRSGISEESTLCVTVWENGTAKRRLPQDLFRGPMDEWWTCDGDQQGASFIGERRRALGIDTQR